ncbi:division/cell wall cluster transcriptional repressor MraZ [Oenococcus alcoholitolerans]|uniref:division/cell wall cluster transcriptional repressor MraZ n=1 Tax=Oenococcus alcoholitolerans TaxID=931074 RepID=UPI003F709493
MFMGEYQHALDDKSRLIIPAKFRNQLGDQFIVTRWMERSLFAFPKDEWQKFEEKLAKLPIGAKDARAFRRFVLAGAMETSFDKQGRIVIPVVLKKHAQLVKNVVITGSGNGFEIWSKDNWEEYTAGTAEKFDQIAEGLTDFDL